DLIAVAAEAGTRRKPGTREGPGGARRVRDVGALVPTVVAGDVLHADDTCLGAAEMPPLADPPHLVPVKDDFPEEIVRGEEHQVSAQVAVALDQVVLVRGRVLLVTGKDDQVVTPREEVAVRDMLEIEVREDVHVSAGAEPPDDRGLEIAEPKRNTGADVRPAD